MSDPGLAVTRDGREVALADDPAGHRYVATIDGEVVALAAYQLTDEIIVFTHTETVPAAEGQGIAGALVRFALDDVRVAPAPGGGTRKVIVVCPFVGGWMARHADEYLDLDYRSRTGRVND